MTDSRQAPVAALHEWVGDLVAAAGGVRQETWR